MSLFWFSECTAALAFGKLMSGSYPYHLRFVSIHLQSVAAHPGFDPLRAVDEPLDSRLYVRGSSADMYLRVIGIRVRLNTLVLIMSNNSAV